MLIAPREMAIDRDRPGRVCALPCSFFRRFVGDLLSQIFLHSLALNEIRSGHLYSTHKLLELTLVTMYDGLKPGDALKTNQPLIHGSSLKVLR